MFEKKHEDRENANRMKEYVCFALHFLSPGNGQNTSFAIPIESVRRKRNQKSAESRECKSYQLPKSKKELIQTHSGAIGNHF